jgi:CMP-N-acetylneuraminic acid synthetase
MNIVALICARGNSKGIKNKNLLKFKNTNLLGNSIQQAKKIKSIKRIFVSTDNKKIAKYALKYGAEVPFKRPSYLSTDSSPEILTWRHAVDHLKNKLKVKPDFIVSLPTTSPLRNIKDIESCIEKAIKNNLDIVFSITKARRNPFFNMVLLKNNKLQIVCNAKKKYSRRQEAPKCYDLTTVCYVFKPDYIKSRNNLFSGKTGFVLIPSQRSLDIDEKIDYKIAKILSKKS